MLKKYSFTLIELLVVISIIAILGSMLTPTLRKAHNSALNAVCTNNLKQIGAACAMYAGEYRGFLPALHHYNNSRNLRVYLASYTGTEEYGRSRNDIWFCPSNIFPFTTDESFYFYSTYAPTFSWGLKSTPVEGFCYFATRDDKATFNRPARLKRIPSTIAIIGNRNPNTLYKKNGKSCVVLTENINNTQLMDKDENCSLTDIFNHNGMSPFLYGGGAIRNAFPPIGNLPYRTINGITTFALEW